MSNWERPSDNTIYHISRKLKTRDNKLNTVTFVAEFLYDVELWHKYMIEIEKLLSKEEQELGLSNEFLALSDIRNKWGGRDYNIFILYVIIGPHHRFFKNVAEMLEKVEMSVVLVTNPKSILTKHQCIMRNRAIQPESKWHKNLSMHLHGFGGAVVCEILKMTQGITLVYPHPTMHKILRNDIMNMKLPQNTELQYYFSQGTEETRHSIIMITCLMDYIKNIDVNDSDLDEYVLPRLIRMGLFKFDIFQKINDLFDILVKSDIKKNQSISDYIQQYSASEKLDIDISQIEDIMDFRKAIINKIVSLMDDALNNDMKIYPIYPEKYTDLSIMSKSEYSIKCWFNSNPVEIKKSDSMHIINSLRIYDTAIDISLLRYYFRGGRTPLHDHNPVVNTELDIPDDHINVIRDHIKQNDDHTIWVSSRPYEDEKYKKIYFKSELINRDTEFILSSYTRENLVYDKLKSEEDCDIYMVWCTLDKKHSNKNAVDINNNGLYVYRFFMVHKKGVPIMYHTLDDLKHVSDISDHDIFITLTHSFGSCVASIIYKGYIKHDFFTLSGRGPHIFISSMRKEQDFKTAVIVGDKLERIMYKFHDSLKYYMDPSIEDTDVWLNYIISENTVTIKNNKYDYQFVAPRYMHRFMFLKDINNTNTNDLQTAVESYFLQTLFF